ncbi:ATP-binding protein [Paludibacterium yongneupense]|uniref:ATP-binding protein n=1 Tax=Paludibacterium yongneupense TaxID=400061 RepID=UPI000407CB12|nr:sensor histidine kinase [Paludibacterium yongneupense]
MGTLISMVKAASFRTRSFLLLLSVSLVLSLIIGQYVFSRMEDSLYRQIGIRALVQAQEIAVMPDVVAAVGKGDVAALKHLILPLKAQSDASYIVIGDAAGRHLMHTDPAVNVGSPMQGGDNYAVLREGQSRVTLKRGTLGLSWRGKAPVRDAAGRVIGVVSVGYFQSRIERWNRSQFMPLFAMLLAVLTALFCCAWLFTRSIKKQMFNLEPLEIARLVRQQEAVFESIYEGVLSLDVDRHLTAINRAARDILELQQSASELLGVCLDELVPDCPFLIAADGQGDKKDEICLFNSVQVIASRVGIHIDGRPQGWVISFRRKDDISTLSLQLSQVKRYADNLRVIRHEHLNWISTVSGLLHIKAYDEVLKLVQSQSATHQKVLDYISMTFGNYHICGLLIGKYYRAQELGLELEFESGCCLDALPDVLTEVEWMSIIGNLLDNAFDATLSSGYPERQIVLYISDVGDEMIVEVADKGRGIAPAVRDTLFERGVSTNDGADRGIGLYLVGSYVKQAGGTITVENNIPYGTVFTVFVPKRTQSNA